MISSTGTVTAVCVSASKGTQKKPVERVRLLLNHGIAGDAHAGPGDRQISLLSVASIDKMRAAGLDVGAGDFGENIVVDGLDLCGLPIGTKLKVGDAVQLEITRIGKVCHERCAIYYQAGDCVMPREGIFAIVLAEGEVSAGDRVELMAQEATTG
ncbi:MAG: MOSC domain-containing protein [Desulfuromonas sp.]|nr:MAG: MOSC domain-containing protein [Desulfuromonas sp.]